MWPAKDDHEAFRSGRPRAGRNLTADAQNRSLVSAAGLARLQVRSARPSTPCNDPDRPMVTMARPSRNEGRVCDAVVRFLEARTGELRTDISHPERDRIGPPVDLRLRLGAQNYALEHTRIEASAGQIQTGREFQELIGPVIHELGGNLPKPGIYHLYFPNDARLGVKADELRKMRHDFVEWVREHAEHLHARNPESPSRDRNPLGIDEQYRGKPPGFPYEVTLRRNAHWSLSSRHDGVLIAARFPPEELETRRADRLRDALDRKCQKLQHCKNEGARTILILEHSDTSLSNYALIGNALGSLLAERSDSPDEVHLVETAFACWDVYLMKCDANGFFRGEVWTEFDSAELKDIIA